MHTTREGEGLLRGVRRRQAEQQAIIVSAEARPMRLAESALFALILVLVLTLWLSPVDLGWWTLALTLVAGGLLMELVFRLARANKLTPTGPSFLDPLARRERDEAGTAT